MRTDLRDLNYNEMRVGAPGGFSNCDKGLSNMEYDARLARIADPAVARKVFDTMPPGFFKIED